MKLSNSAITMLMAAYRAVFKNAYYKGLVGAALLSAGMGVTSAQAANTKWENLKPTTGNIIEVTGKASDNPNQYQFFTIDNGGDNSGDFIINVTGGDAHYIKDHVKGEKIDINLNASTGTVKFLIDGSSQASSLTVDNFAAKNGTVIISGGNNTAALSANTITVGSSATLPASKPAKGIVQLNANGTLGRAAQEGVAASTTTLNADGEIKFGDSTNSTSGGTLVGKLEGKGGKLTFANNGTVQAWGTSETNKNHININVESGATAKFELTDNNNTTKDNEGLLQISEGTIDIKQGTSTGGTLAINKGTLQIDGTAKLVSTGTNTSGSLSISGNGTNNGKLIVSAATLKGFIAPTETSKFAKGAVDVKANGELRFSDETFKANDFTYANGTAAAGSILVADGGVISAQNIAVSKELKTASNATFKADKDLILGDSGKPGSVIGGFKELHGKNVNFVNTPVLAGSVVLESTTKDKYNKVIADNGLISGDVILGSSSSGSITIKAGEYTANGKITLDSESASNKIKVSGDGSLKTSLDLTQATIDAKNNGSSKFNQISIKNGTLVLNQSNIDSLHKPNGDNKASTIFLEDNAKVNVVGDLAIASEKIGYANYDNEKDGKIIFNAQNGEYTNKLTVDGQLSISGSMQQAGLDIRRGHIQANSLFLNNTSSGATKVLLITGQYTALSSATTYNNQWLGLGHGSEEQKDVVAILNLGGTQSLDENDGCAPSVSLSNGGQVASLELYRHSIVNVLTGSWSGGDINFANIAASAPESRAKLNIGAETPLFNEKGELISASFSANKVNMNNGAGLIKVNSGASASFKELTASGGAQINVYGDLNIAGNYTAPDSYGVAIANDVLTVNDGGSLSFGADAMKAITVNKENVEIANGTLGTIKLNGGEVVLAYDKNTNFTKNALSSLKTSLFGDSFSSNPLNGRLNIGSATIEGLSTLIQSGEAKWSDLSAYQDVTSSIYQEQLAKTTVTNITTETVVGNYGALKGNTVASGSSLNVGGYSSLNAAKNGLFAFNDKNDVLGLSVQQNGKLELANGGEVAAITLGENAALRVNSNGGVTKLASITGANSDLTLSSAGETQVSGKVTIGDIDTVAGSQLNIADTLNAGSDAYFDGYLSVGGKATFGSGSTCDEVEFNGGATFKAGVEANTFVGIYNKDVNVESGDSTFKSDLEVGAGATFNAQKVNLAGSLDIVEGGTVKATSLNLNGSQQVINVGADAIPGEQSSTGYLEVSGNFDLKGNTLVIDPDYEQATSIAAIKKFGSASVNDNVISGFIHIAQNSALAVGKDATLANTQEFLKNYQSGNHLQADGVGAVMIVDDKIEVAKRSQIIVAPRHTAQDIEQLEKFTTSSSDLFLGEGAVLALTDNAYAKADANNQKGSIHFQAQSAEIASEEGAKIVLDGNQYLNGNQVNLFTAGSTPAASNVTVASTDSKGKGLRVETLNGLMYFYLANGTVDKTEQVLKADVDALKKAFVDGSSSTQELLRVYTASNLDWSNVNPSLDTQLLGQAVAGSIEKGVFTPDDDAAYQEAKKKGQIIEVNNSRGQLTGVYYKPYNPLLAQATQNSQSVSGVEVDKVAHLSVFGGTAQAALYAGQASSEVVSGRFGVAAQKAVNVATNEQGSSLWVSPMYKSVNSDGFNAGGVNYGVDIDLYGVALGGDYTLSNGVKFGAMFNVGSGDADGNQSAQGVKNDFDFYGFTVYGGYSFNNFSIVGDIGYTSVDNDLSVNVFDGKAQASADSSNLSFGVTAQYKLNVNSFDITPHAALRYSIIDMDDLNVKYANNAVNENVASYKGDKLNVFSIPVGVTVSKDILMGEWIVQPSFDLTVTANFGDDDIEDNVDWGFSNYQTAQVSEFMDSFTYGANAGVAVNNGNFSLGLGVNYTRSSNTDGYGINANARFVF